jgi:hypothetical protein
MNPRPALVTKIDELDRVDGKVRIARGDDRGPHTDAGNAERLTLRHGREVRYCYPSGQWLVWDGRRLKPDDTGEIVRWAVETRGLMGRTDSRKDEWIPGSGRRA